MAIESLECEYVKLIPFGKVATFSEIARICGTGSSARAVSCMINKNLENPEIPVHRVVKSDGSINPKIKKQKILLLNEGVRVEKNKVDLQIFGFYFW